jgi:hypothetical protein
MDLALKRTESSPDGIFGVLSDPTGKQVAVTLEHSFGDRPAITPGAYLCVRGSHILKGMDLPFETFEITNVPGHTGILFHVGNFNQDSSGCVLLGKSVVKNMITHSLVAFLNFMELQQGSTFWLTIR